MTGDGYLAQWNGQQYEASPSLDDGRLTIRLYSPDPADGFEQVSADRYVRAVPLAEIDELHHVATVCHWTGAPFRVLRRDGTRLLLEYTGDQPAEAHLGLTRTDPGVHRTWVDEADVHPQPETTRLR
jgi:hypothetical protein